MVAESLDRVLFLVEGHLPVETSRGEARVLQNSNNEVLGLDELRNWLPGLCEAGMVGLETYYGPYTPENERELLALAQAYNLIPTGGTDFHGPGMHPTPLGGRYVPFEAVEHLKVEAAKRRSKTPPSFKLPPPVQEK